jgi:uncharacterized phage protein gp47/JayE
MAFIDVPVVTDTDSLKQTALDSLTDSGWNPEDGDPEVVVVEALAPAAQNAAEVAAVVFPAIWRKFGTDLAGIPYLQGVAAEALATFTLVDDGAAHTIPDETAIQIGGIYFQTVGATAVSAHATTATGVLVRAVNDGADGNDLTGSAQLVNTLAWVTAVTLTTTSSGGADAEDDDGYQDRLRPEIQSQGPPVTDEDFAVKAFDTPGVGVGRATAVTTAAKTVTVSVTDILGNPLTSDDKTAISAYLADKREVNFVVTVQDATYNYLAITFSFHLASGFVQQTVIDNIATALQGLLNPATWGSTASVDPLTAPANAWGNETTVRLSRITALIQDVRGVDYISSGTVKINGTAADFTLTGTAPLPILPADVTFTGTTHTNTTVDGIASTTGLHPKMGVTGSGIPAGTTIATVAANSITISAAATASATVSIAATAIIATVI